MKGSHIARLAAFSLALTACRPKIELPVRTGFIEGSAESEVDRVVCHSRALAAAQGMSFHFGTFRDSDGPKATIRMIGDRYELNLAKWTANEPYELRAYDISKDGSRRNAAEQAFNHFRATFSNRIGQTCDS